MNKKANFALSLLLEQAKRLKEVDSMKIENTLKDDELDDLLSNYDEEVERKIVSALHEEYPEDGFLTEEKATHDSIKEALWILDPIDGTTNFVTKKRDYAISLAYYENLKPIFGIIVDVENEDVYFAETGNGATLNGNPLPKIRSKLLKDSVVDFSLKALISLEKKDLDLKKLNKKIRAQRSSGCASLNLCHIAKGELDFYVSGNVKSWDFAAGNILLNEVGGAWNLPFDDEKMLHDHAVIYFASNSQNLIDEFLSFVKNVNNTLQ